ncbi:MAG: hypothetical protein KDD62_15225, partial [Bdellovibrionales bacterium]|nr:hypothetical protein [Bdellovibrionales bacterium]
MIYRIVLTVLLLAAPGIVGAQSESELPLADQAFERDVEVVEAFAEDGEGLAEAEAKVEVITVDEEPSTLKQVNSYLFSILFYDVSFGFFHVMEEDRFGNPVIDEARVQKRKTVSVPLVVAVLSFGAIFFTFFYGFVNIRGFLHAIAVV